MFYFLFLLLTSPDPAYADALSDACPGLKDLAEEVYICEDNADAADRAEKCAQLLLGSSKVAAAALQVAITKQSAGSAQDKALVKTKSDYDTSVAALNSQIKFLEKYTDLIATYPDVMMDAPESQSAEDSLDCFNTAFDRVQKVVDQLDAEIKNAKRVRDTAVKLSGISQDSLERLSANIKPIVQKPSPATAIPGGFAGASGADLRDSDVTGTIDDEMPDVVLGSRGEEGGPAQSSFPVGSAGNFHESSDDGVVDASNGSTSPTSDRAPPGGGSTELGVGGEVLKGILKDVKTQEDSAAPGRSTSLDGYGPAGAGPSRDVASVSERTIFQTMTLYLRGDNARARIR